MVEIAEAGEEARERRVQRLKQHHARVGAHLAQQPLLKLCNTHAKVTLEKPAKHTRPTQALPEDDTEELLPGERYLRTMALASSRLSFLLLAEAAPSAAARTVRGQWDGGEKSGYGCWPCSMVKPSTSTRPLRHVSRHFPRKHSDCGRRRGQRFVRRTDHAGIGLEELRRHLQPFL